MGSCSQLVVIPSNGHQTLLNTMSYEIIAFDIMIVIVVEINVIGMRAKG